MTRKPGQAITEYVELRKDEFESDDDAKVMRPAHVLPPCKVCAAQATGFHYGINSCEACKGFFRRSILRTKEYRCSDGVKCQMRPGKHKLCPRCRYHKCLAVGMSVQGIKTGRYTYEKKTKDILELKGMEIKRHPEKKNTEEPYRLEPSIEEIIEEARALVENAENMLHGMNAVVDEKEIRSKQSQFLQDPNSIIEGINKIMYGSSPITPETPSEQAKRYGYTMTSCVKDARTELQGIPMHGNDDEDDDLTKDIKTSWLKTVEFGIKCLVRFIKSVPGFKTLHMEDQLNLIKHSFVEAWLVSRHHAFDMDQLVYTASNGFTLEVGRTVTDDMFGSVMRSVHRLQKLHLTKEETYVLQVIVQLFTDRCEMKMPEKIDELQSYYVCMFQRLLEYNHKSDKLAMAKAMGVLTELRNLTAELYKAGMKARLPFIEKSAPLLVELVSSIRNV